MPRIFPYKYIHYLVQTNSHKKRNKSHLAEWLLSCSFFSSQSGLNEMSTTYSI